jgi:hypothetical protein
VSTLSNGEFTFSLKEKVDRFKNMYLFGAIQLFNCVIFVRPSGQSGADGLPRWNAVVRPYTGQQGQRNPDEYVWEEETPDVVTARRQKP